MKRVIRLTILFFVMFGFIYISFGNISTVDAKNNKAEVITITHKIHNNDNTVNIDELYAEAIDEVANVIKKINVDNVIDTYFIFEHLLSKGYLSKVEPTFTEDENKVLDLNEEELLGLDVIYGYMNCRHITDFYTKVLQKLGYDAYALPCFITDNENENSNIPNHVITVINDSKPIYIDATNKIIFNVYAAENKLTDANHNYYIIPMANYSAYDKGVVVSHNSDNDIIYINKIIDDNKELYSNNYINKEYFISTKKIIKNKKIINNFKDNYKRNIINNLPDKNTYMTNKY